MDPKAQTIITPLDVCVRRLPRQPQHSVEATASLQHAVDLRVGCCSCGRRRRGLCCLLWLRRWRHLNLWLRLLRCCCIDPLLKTRQGIQMQRLCEETQGAGCISGRECILRALRPKRGGVAIRLHVRRDRCTSELPTQGLVATRFACAACAASRLPTVAVGWLRSCGGKRRAAWVDKAGAAQKNAARRVRAESEASFVWLVHAILSSLWTSIHECSV